MLRGSGFCFYGALVTAISEQNFGFIKICFARFSFLKFGGFKLSVSLIFVLN